MRRRRELKLQSRKMKLAEPILARNLKHALLARGETEVSSEVELILQADLISSLGSGNAAVDHAQLVGAPVPKSF